MQAECRRQIYLHYAEPTLRSECRNQVYLGYAEPRGVEAHEVWLTAAERRGKGRKVLDKEGL